MKHLTNSLITALTTAVLSCTAAFAQADPFQAFRCDIGQNEANQIVQFIPKENNHRKFPLRITNSGNGPSFFCQNAGGVVKDIKPGIPFDTISVEVRRTGNIDLCDDIDIAFKVKGDPWLHYFCLTDARNDGTSFDGYTTYTLTGQRAEHEGDLITKVGVVVDNSRSGVVSIDNLRVNGQSFFKDTNNRLNCPLSDNSECGKDR